MSAITVLRLALLLLALAPLPASAHAVAAPPFQDTDPPAHQPPVTAPVLDPFRAPPEPWLAGNRGIEYDTRPGDMIRASAPGVVTFAGSVAGHHHVTVRHSIDLVTTAAFVGEVLVETGDVVAAGDPIARAAGPFHFTARRNGQYVDPAALFEVVRYGVRLVPIR